MPSDKKFKADGCGAIVDPHAIIASCRRLVGQQKVKSISTKVETKDWIHWDAKGENVIGSKGKRTELYIYIAFHF